MMSDYDKMLFYKKQCAVLINEIGVAKEKIFSITRALEDANHCLSGAEFEYKICKQFLDLYTKRVNGSGGTESTAVIDIS